MKKKSNRLLGYMCGVTYTHELGETEVKLYSSIDALKAAHKCWKECGIVRLGVTNGQWKVKWIAKEKPFKAGKKRQAPKAK